MKGPELKTQGTVEKQRGAVGTILAEPCPDDLLCHRWASEDGGAYCRLCWRDFTSPKPLRVVEGRA